MCAVQVRPVSKPPAPPAAAPRHGVLFGDIETATAGHRVVLYGPGGIGKTTASTQLPGPVALIDLEDSLPILRPQLEAAGRLANIKVVRGVNTWAALRGALQADGWDAIRTIVIDTGTKAEELAIAHTLENVMTEHKTRVTSIEGYGYGKGFTYVFDTFLPLLADLDRHARAGRNVVILCHDCTTTVPNPSGEDWIRYEPRLQSPNSGKASIRLRVKEWADHVLYVGYDVSVDKDGKGKGAGTRTLYTAELPHCMAKSRTTGDIFPVENDVTGIWQTILGQ